MPLRDHFHGPLVQRLPWDSLHSAWASCLVEDLNNRWLPAPFIALEHTHVGPRIEIDVATFEGPAQAPLSQNGGAVATMAQTWAPPTALCTVPIIFPDRFEVRVFAGPAGWYLVGAVEFISPGNKDRPEARHALAAKCATYLHEGVSVILIDVVTERRAPLHNELLQMINVADTQAFFPDDVHLYASAYRPVLRGEKEECEVWAQGCAVGQALPTMPLCLTQGLFVPVDFEATYTMVCRNRRVV